jgi:hypothetical protein
MLDVYSLLASRSVVSRDVFPLDIKLRPRGTPSAFLSVCTCFAILPTLSALKSAPSCFVLGCVVLHCSLAR